MSTPLPQPNAASSPAVTRRRNPWPLTLIVIVLIVAVVLAGTILALKMISGAEKVADMPSKIAATLADAFRPNQTVNILLSSTIGEMHSHPKLVVLTTLISAEVEKSSNTTWAGINFGTTIVRVRARENKVQYYIPLQGLQTSNFVYDDKNKKLIVSVPAPRLDEELVDVQSDPTKIDVETSNGWAKLDSFSGAPLRDEAHSELRNAVLAAGRQVIMEHEAERRGQEVLKNVLHPIIEALKPDVDLDIEFLPRQ